WQIESGRLDPYEVNSYSLRAVLDSRSNEEAERAIRLFVRAFRDRHFTVERPDGPSVIRDRKRKRARFGSLTTPETACAALSIEDTDLDFEIPWASLPGFQRLPGSPDFPAGILEVNGRRIGVVRIASFSDRDFGRTCRAVWEEARREMPYTCYDACQIDFLM